MLWCSFSLHKPCSPVARPKFVPFTPPPVSLTNVLGVAGGCTQQRDVAAELLGPASLQGHVQDQSWTKDVIAVGICSWSGGK